MAGFYDDFKDSGYIYNVDSFFKPYSSTSDLSTTLVKPITAPILFLCAGIQAFVIGMVMGGIALLNASSELGTASLSMFVASITAFSFALASPFVAIAEIIARSGATIGEYAQATTFDRSGTAPGL